MKHPPIQRPPEIEELTNRFLIHPVGDFFLKPLAAAGVHPNFVSLIGLLAGGGAAYSYYHYYQNPMAALSGFLLMLAWHITDGIDGRLARMTGKSSRIGKIVDGVVDYAVFILVYVFMSLGSLPDPDIGYWLAWYGSFAGAFHILQAAAYEKKREEYIVWKSGRFDDQAPADADRGKSGLSLAAFGLDWLYQQIQVIGGTSGMMQRLKGELLKAPEEVQNLIRREYSIRYAPLVRCWSLLSANIRTIAIFLACLLANPLYYFLFEIVILNLVMFWLIMRQRQLDRNFLAWIEAEAYFPMKS